MQLKFRYTPDEYRDGWRVHWRRVADRRAMGIPNTLVGIGSVAVAALLVTLGISQHSISTVLFAIVFVCVAWTSLVHVAPLRRRIVEQSLAVAAGPAAPVIVLHVHRQGISLGNRWDVRPWSSFIGRDERRGVLVLLQAGASVFIPTRAFPSPDAARRFVELFDTLSKRPRAHGFPVQVAGADTTADPVDALRNSLPPAPLPYMVIDAFAARAFTGNPAACVWLDEPLSDEDCQSLAAEFNLAETAFIRPLSDGRFELRWFTPTREVPLCGHATLAAAAALLDGNRVTESQSVRFVTRHSGELTCTFDGDHVVMDFPATPPAPADPPPDAAAVLGIDGPVECVGSTPMNLTLRLPTEAHVRQCRPDLARLATWHSTGVTVTAPSATPNVDFVSRFFAPQSGIPEDPVTGSAQCALAVYWAGVLGKTAFAARQLSPRTGDLGVTLKGDRVELRGRAVVVMRGTVTL